jgi:hypothetical protein
MLGQWAFGSGVSSGTLTLSAQVRNTANVPIFLRFPFPGTTQGADAVQVPSNGVAAISSSWPAGTCDHLPRLLGSLYGFDDPTTITIPIDASVRDFAAFPGTPGTVDPYQTAIEIPHRVLAQLQAQVRHVCAAQLATG